MTGLQDGLDVAAAVYAGTSSNRPPAASGSLGTHRGSSRGGTGWCGWVPRGGGVAGVVAGVGGTPVPGAPPCPYRELPPSWKGPARPLQGGSLLSPPTAVRRLRTPTRPLPVHADLVAIGKLRCAVLDLMGGCL